MNDRYAQEPPPRTRSRIRRLAVASATAFAIVTTGAGGAKAADLSLDNDIVPAPSPGLLQRGMVPYAPVIGPGFIAMGAAHEPQTGKAYTLRLVEQRSESMRSAAEFAAAQIAAISDITITVAPGTITEAVPGIWPTNGDIILSVEDSCGPVAGCAGPSRRSEVTPFGRSTVVGGRIWIHPTVATNYTTSQRRAVVSHEIGHALGLDHFDGDYRGQTQVMKSSPYETGGVYREGDANGLRFVARPQVELRNQNTTGDPDETFLFGGTQAIGLKGDWDGDGVDTVGAFHSATASWRLENGPGVADTTFEYGAFGDTPIVGDWDGDGIDTIGVVRGERVYLRNSNTRGNHHIAFECRPIKYKPLGANDRLLIGDWNGDGIDTIGIRRGDEIDHLGRSWGYFYNTNETNTSAFGFPFGTPADIPVVGDWNGNGIDTIGLKRGEQWILRNFHSSSTTLVDVLPKFGQVDDKPLVGDWDGDGDDTVGVYR